MFKTNPIKLREEHDAEVRAIETAAFAAVMKKLKEKK